MGMLIVFSEKVQCAILKINNPNSFYEIRKNTPQNKLKKNKNRELKKAGIEPGNFKLWPSML